MFASISFFVLNHNFTIIVTAYTELSTIHITLELRRNIRLFIQARKTGYLPDAHVGPGNRRSFGMINFIKLPDALLFIFTASVCLGCLYYAFESSFVDILGFI